MAAAVDWLVVGGPVEPWQSIGLVVADSRIPLFGTGIEIGDPTRPGMTGWVLAGVDPDIEHIDGLATAIREPSPPMFADHPLGARRIDHVVVATDSLARTCGAIADITGAPLKRVREAGDIRQGFHRIGGLIVEVVERTGLPERSTALWGFVLVVDDLDAACASLGPDVISEARAAVQPGRSIATFRDSAGLGTPVALMSPDPR